jgi:cytochrome b6-f complex iron-sulfur subunit
MLTQESISRKDFLRSMGLGGAALMAVLASCKSADSVAPSGVSIDISTAIKNVGDYTYSSGAIIARVSAGSTAASFVALSQACTHQGTSITYQGNGVFYCPNHGAQFSTTGSVTRGPASSSLSKYAVTITGSTLTIS